MKNIIYKFTNPFLISVFFLQKLPLAFFVGIRLNNINNLQSSVSIKYSYITKNPFQSIYFACLAMAAEFASGTLVLFHVHETKIKFSTLVTGFEAKFHKKALGKIVFECNDGELIQETVQKAILSKEGQEITNTVLAKDQNGFTVASFIITWGIKAK